MRRWDVGDAAGMRVYGRLAQLVVSWSWKLDRDMRCILRQLGCCTTKCCLGPQV